MTVSINLTVNKLSDRLGNENELAFGEDNSDIEIDFSDGIRNMLAEQNGESGSLRSDYYDELGNIDWCE